MRLLRGKLGVLTVPHMANFMDIPKSGSPFGATYDAGNKQGFNAQDLGFSGYWRHARDS